MRSKIVSGLTVIGAVTVLVLAANTVALATTGSALIAGKTTTAGKATTVKRTTSGTAFKVKTKKSSNSPFAVNGRGRVANLNADLVDGLDSSQLRTRSYVFKAPNFTNQDSVRVRLDLPNGSYNVTYSLFADGAEAGGVECYVLQDAKPNQGIDQYTAWSSQVHTTGSGWDPALTGAGLVTKSAATDLSVGCDSDTGDFSSTFPDTPFQIVATPTQVVSSRTAPFVTGKKAARR
ncbi:hypothetical protein ABIE44_002154 [Marmoricola sp. OAE513]|uniref:hypothetical protein n=1 Tax=Marmoricola sp. OAE513 TaxID=2817894 RepID=UPI001AEA0C6C